MLIKFDEREKQIGEIRATTCLAYGVTPAFDFESRSIYFTGKESDLSPSLKKTLNKILDKEITAILKEIKKLKLSVGKAEGCVLSDNSLFNGFYINASIGIMEIEAEELSFNERDINLISKTLDTLDIDIIYTLKSACRELNSLLEKHGINGFFACD